MIRRIFSLRFCFLWIYITCVNRGNDLFVQGSISLFSTRLSCCRLCHADFALRLATPRPHPRNGSISHCHGRFLFSSAAVIELAMSSSGLTVSVMVLLVFCRAEKTRGELEASFRRWHVLCQDSVYRGGGMWSSHVAVLSRFLSQSSPLHIFGPTADIVLDLSSILFSGL
jgi:hypothetical protein